MTNTIFIENVDEKSTMSSNFDCTNSSMDDNVVVFVTTNEMFFNYNNIFYHMNKKT
jgi:hypothetical protein